ncbi:hypothetical protein V2J09_013387 [Rumex salicifolius]
MKLSESSPSSLSFYSKAAAAAVADQDRAPSPAIAFSM